MQFLENINHSLHQMVAAAARDYVKVNNLAKQYYSGQANPDERITEMIAALQYMDVFSQRVSHLVETHNKMMNEKLAKDFTESFYHLHVFQAMTIEWDLLHSISSIRAILQQVKVEDTEEQIHWLQEAPFGNVIFVKITLKKIIDEFLRVGGDTWQLPAPFLTSEQKVTLHSLYTMDEERLVLDWFLESMPGGSWDDLLSHYVARITKGKADTIELF